MVIIINMGVIFTDSQIDLTLYTGTVFISLDRQMYYRGVEGRVKGGLTQ